MALCFPLFLNAVEKITGFLLGSKDVSVFEELRRIDFDSIKEFALFIPTWAFLRELIEDLKGRDLFPKGRRQLGGIP